LVRCALFLCFALPCAPRVLLGFPGGPFFTSTAVLSSLSAGTSSCETFRDVVAFHLVLVLFPPPFPGKLSLPLRLGRSPLSSRFLAPPWQFPGPPTAFSFSPNIPQILPVQGASTLVCLSFMLWAPQREPAPRVEAVTGSSCFGHTASSTALALDRSSLGTTESRDTTSVG